MSKTTNYNFDKQKWGHQIREDDLNRIAANLDLIDAEIHNREGHSGWSYRKSHDIANAAGAGTKYQKRIIVHHGNGTDNGEDVYCGSKCKTDFADVRFTTKDGKTELNYWRQEVREWEPLKALPNENTDPTAAAGNGKIYLFGGSEIWGDATNHVYEYDPSTNQWASKTNMMSARWSPTAVWSPNTKKIYVFGGWSGTAYTNVCDEYDPVTDSWVSKTNMPYIIGSQGGVYRPATGLIHLIGGKTSGGGANYHFTYNPVNDSYDTTTYAVLPRSTYWHVTAIVNDKIYVICGGTSASPSDHVDIYNPTSNSWSLGRPCPDEVFGVPRENPVIDDKIYIVSGQDNAVFYNAVYEYDPIGDFWRINDPSGYHKDGGAFAIVNNLLYCMGGRISATQAGIRGNVERYPSPVGVFWVEIAEDLGVDQTIFMYYGNSSATYSNPRTHGEDTFRFFDGEGFDGVIDWENKWQSTNHAGYSIVDNELRCAVPIIATEMLNTINSYGDGVAVQSKIKSDNAGAGLYLLFEQDVATFTAKDYGLLFWGQNQLQSKLNGTPAATDVVKSLVEHFTIKHFCPSVGDAKTEIWRDNTWELGSLVHSQMGTPAYRTVYPSFLNWVSGYGYVDYVFVRKYVSPEPTHGAWGVEEQI